MHVAGFKYFIVFIIHEQGADNKIPVSIFLNFRFSLLESEPHFCQFNLI